MRLLRVDDKLARSRLLLCIASALLILTACDQGPGPVQPTTLPQTTATVLNSGPTPPDVIDRTPSVANTPTSLSAAATATGDAACTPTRGELAQLRIKTLRCAPR
jgi:hypothetical protein